MFAIALLLAATASAQSVSTVDSADEDATLPFLDAPEGPHGIVSGQEESGYPATVGLGAFNYTACSGSLITPRIVLSAAHCSADIPLATVVELGSAYFGDTPATAVHTIGFADAIAHPDYHELGTDGPYDLGSDDVAVLILDEDAPVTPVWFNTEPLTDEDIGQLVTSVGFGITGSANQDSGGVKRSAVLTVSDLDEMFIVSDSTDNDNGANVCSGDSGGPQYHEGADGRILQWSVHSWADRDCVYQSGSTRTDLVADWILAQVEAVHGTSDVCAVNGHYGDGICDEFCDSVDEDCIIEDYGPESRAACGCANTRAPVGILGWLAGVIGLLVLRRRE